QAVDDDARGMLAQGVTGVRRYGADGERRLDDLGVFVQSFAPPPRMLVFGAIDFAAAVARAGKFLGYRVTVCDARPVFATAARFPEAGLTEAELARLRSPIGLDLGARTPEETAVAIAAELIQLRWGGTGQPLTVTSGRIHHNQPA